MTDIATYNGGAYGTELVNNLIGTADKALYESKKTRDTYMVIDIT